MLPEDLEVSPLIMIVSPSKHDCPRMEILAPEQVTSGPSGWTKLVEQKYLLNNCQLPLRTHTFKIVGPAVEIKVFMGLGVHPCSLSEAEFSIVLLGTINLDGISISFLSVLRRALQRDNASLVMNWILLQEATIMAPHFRKTINSD